MYVLAFRDMHHRDRGGVTTAGLYRIDGVDAAYSWNPARPLELKPADVGRFAQDVQGAHVCFLVHGFNVNRDEGYTGGGAMAQEFKGEGPLPTLPGGAALNLLTPGADLFIPVLWPGDWLVPLNYPFVLKSARAVGRNFAQFLTSRSATMRRVSFFSHSFGVRVVLETMQNALRPPPGNTGRSHAPPAFDTAVLTAAAAPETVLESPFYADAVAALRHIHVVSARTDEVLTNWFPIGNAVEKALWKNDPGPNIAMGRDGPVLSATAAARAKTSWFVVTDTHGPMGQVIEQRHGDYMPAPLDPPHHANLPNGWTDKRERISSLTQALLDGTAPPWAARASLPET